MTQDIRPGYYKSAAPEYRHILLALGFKPEDLDIECELAWEKLNLQYSAAGSSAVKYLWRCGKKGPALQDLIKASYWLTKFVYQLEVEVKDGIHVCGEDITDSWPSIEAIDNAIALVGKALEELNGPTV